MFVNVSAERSLREGYDPEGGINSSQSTVNSTRSSRQSNLSTVPTVHIPYRNSKLTWLLSDSLGGNARTTMIASEFVFQMPFSRLSTIY